MWFAQKRSHLHRDELIVIQSCKPLCRGCFGWGGAWKKLCGWAGGVLARSNLTSKIRPLTISLTLNHANGKWQTLNSPLGPGSFNILVSDWGLRAATALNVLSSVFKPGIPESGRVRLHVELTASETGTSYLFNCAIFTRLVFSQTQTRKKKSPYIQYVRVLSYHESSKK